LRRIDPTYLILIVDDDEVDRRHYARSLRGSATAQFDIVEARDGTAGLSELRLQKPDCILLDYHLPDMTGIEFMTGALDGDELPCAILMITGQGNEQVAVDAMKRGALDYIVKGEISQKILQRAITNSIAQFRLSEQLAASQLDLLTMNEELAEEVKKRKLVEVDLRTAIRAAEETNLRRRLALEEQARIADELRRWAAAFQNAAFGINISDAVGQTVRFANPAYAAMHGMTVEGVQGRRCLDLYAPNQRERVSQFLATADQLGQVTYRSDLIRSDDTSIPVEMHVTSVRGPDGNLLYRIVTARDVTRQHQLEAELAQSQKLEALGQLAAGVAHDFNNAMQGQMIYLQLLGDEMHDRPKACTYLTTMLKNTDRVSELALQLLSFCRKQALNPTEVQLRSLLIETKTILTHTLGPLIDIQITTENGLLPLKVDRVHLQTALINLAVNARDAMPSGGRLSMTASMTRGPTPYAVIDVTDTGCGISPQVLTKVFDPFFTTKGVNGTGLGLSMTHGFVKQSGGDLTIESNLGEGTHVRLRFPLASFSSGCAVRTVDEKKITG
jgi:PAS domain S-box-containing protein